jgi:hypothetical protein
LNIKKAKARFSKWDFLKNGNTTVNKKTPIAEKAQSLLS